MKKVKAFIAMFAVVVAGAVAVTPMAPALAYNPLDSACSGDTTSAVCAHKDEKANSLIGNLINTLLFIVGILSVIMIIVGGIMYTTSTGDSGKVSKAKNTITYSIVGLVVAFVAYAVINWIMKLF